MTELLPVAILAGGRGTRLGDLTKNDPKCLVRVYDAPFLEHQLHLLHAKGVRRVVLCLGYHARAVEDWLDYSEISRLFFELSVSCDGPIPLGTAGAIRKAIPLLGDHFFVMYGDSYLDCDFVTVQDQFATAERGGLVTVCPATAGRFDGKIICYPCNNMVASYANYGNFVDCGLSIFDAGVFERSIDRRRGSLGDVCQKLISDHDLASYNVVDRFHEIGSPEGLKETEAYLKAKVAK